MNFIIDEFGKGELTYAMNCFRTEIAEMLLDACRVMETSKAWIKTTISSTQFYNSYK